MKYIIIYLIILFLNNNISIAQDSNQYKYNNLGTNFYYNTDNNYFFFKPGFILDVYYERVLNRWFGLQTSFGYNRAKTKLNDWKYRFFTEGIADYPSLSSSILLSMSGNFYCLHKINHKIKIGLGIEYRNITDVITTGAVYLYPDSIQNNYQKLYPITSFEQYNDLGFSGNLNYQYKFKKGIGISSTFGFNYYFLNTSKQARTHNRISDSQLLLKFGIGAFYSF
ncbi:MAG TPA: hypothetical protein PLC61_06535 [Chitinophagales bacterium]|nr:hypothetical protein [Chitinophagales bacterium]MCB9074358.1 hypothetical protein [Chitinophagales bacterium]MCB9075178.1 hypothetical protein [Chitinophagales bacterium]HMU99246.1 hypothetical protein [Chitinophagales bacterium]HMV03777.1 hypothetical protein [Chitinophagales bacterium]